MQNAQARRVAKICTLQGQESDMRNKFKDLRKEERNAWRAPGIINKLKKFNAIT